VLTISKIGDIVQIAQNVLFVLKSFFEKQNRTLNDESGLRSFVLRKGEIRNAFSGKKGFVRKKNRTCQGGNSFCSDILRHFWRGIYKNE
jgi:hypothetical protein